MKTFVSQLQQHDVTRVIDVRENAWSQRRAFVKHNVQTSLNNAGIEYQHLQVLGAPKQLRNNLQGKEFFKAYQRYINNRQATLQALEQSVHEKRTALLCYEDDHTTCHRKVLVEQINTEHLQIKHL